jgi:hypothetical protein
MGVAASSTCVRTTWRPLIHLFPPSTPHYGVVHPTLRILPLFALGRQAVNSAAMWSLRIGRGMNPTRQAVNRDVEGFYPYVLFAPRLILSRPFPRDGTSRVADKPSTYSSSFAWASAAAPSIPDLAPRVASFISTKSLEGEHDRSLSSLHPYGIHSFVSPPYYTLSTRDFGIHATLSSEHSIGTRSDCFIVF